MDGSTSDVRSTLFNCYLYYLFNMSSNVKPSTISFPFISYSPPYPHPNFQNFLLTVYDTSSTQFPLDSFGTRMDLSSQGSFPVSLPLPNSVVTRNSWSHGHTFTSSSSVFLSTSTLIFLFTLVPDRK